jgi:hypothetical protein
MTDVGVTPFVDAPSAVAYGQVKGRFVQYVADTTDVGVVPDEVPLEGRVTLTPLTQIVQFPSTVPPRMAVASPVQALVSNGDLKGLQGQLLYVIATDQPAGIPNKVQWRASFQLSGIATQPASVVFEVPANGVVDLSMAISVPLAAPVVTVVNHADAQAAALSSAQALTSKNSAAASQTAAATSATNAAASAASAAAVAGKIYTGTGSPENVVSAPVGSLYEDTAATRGATLWTKVTGSSTIGWKVAYGDTGWRTLIQWSGGVVTQGAFASGTWGPHPTQPGSVKLRRIGPNVYAQLLWPTALVGDGTGAMFTIPTGFNGSGSTPVVPVPFGVAYSTVFMALIASFARNQGTMPVNDSFGRYATLQVSWFTDEAWPTTLPGV